MSKSYEISGYYGSLHTPCIVFCVSDWHGTWYVIENSCNVNHTFYTELENGTDVELLPDDDYFYISNGIDSLESLENAINE